MNLLSKHFTSAAIVLACSLSQASDPIYYTINGGSTQQVNLNPISDTFSGVVNVSMGLLCQFSCTVNARATLNDVIAGDTTLSISDITFVGQPFCSLIFLDDAPWEGSLPHYSIPSPLEPISFTLDNASLTASICGTCNNQINVTFDPNDGGSVKLDGPITPNGNCNFVGSLTSTSGNYYELWH